MLDVVGHYLVGVEALVVYQLSKQCLWAYMHGYGTVYGQIIYYHNDFDGLTRQDRVKYAAWG
jgi:hypothetical protein